MEKQLSENSKLTLFYNNKYKNILLTKLYKLKIKHLPNDYISYKYEDNFIVKDSNYYINKKESSYNLIKNIQYRNIMNTCDIFKYYYNTIKYECFFYNYIIKKYSSTITNKNILLFSETNNINYDNSIFSNYGYYLFKHGYNYNIYEIIDDKNNDKYIKEVINKKNNNTHHLIIHNTDGDIYNKKTINEVINRLRNIKFNIIIFQNDIKKYVKFIDNINIILIDMYIVSRICDPKTIIYYLYYKTLENVNYDYIQPIILFKNLFNKILLLNVINNSVTLTLKLSKIDNKSKMYTELENIVNNIISGKKTIIFDTIKQKFNTIDDFINNINNLILNKQKLILALLKMRNTNYFIYKIIEEQIDNAQNDILHNKKYKKYLLPF